MGKRLILNQAIHILRNSIQKTKTQKNGGVKSVIKKDYGIYKMNLNIGCGHLNRERGEVGIDIDLHCRPDVQGDVQVLPFKNESFESINAVHVLEHVPNITKTLNECWRVLKKDGQFNIRVPLFPTTGSIADPSHVRYFIVPSFDYFCEKGKLSGLNHPFKMEGIAIRNLTHETQEIVCSLRKYG